MSEDDGVEVLVLFLLWIGWAYVLPALLASCVGVVGVG